MYFRDIPGKTAEKRILINQVRQDKIAHAQLFLGKEGYGGLAMAIAFSRYVMCRQPLEEDACGTCESCKKFDHYAKPDIHFVYPMVKYKNLKREDTISTDALADWKKALADSPFLSLTKWLECLESEGSTPNVNVKECHDIIYKLSLMSFDGGYKILIFWLPEFLGKDGNRLLKLIEEPPAQTLLLFISQDADAILPTILSRCQILRIAPFESEDITSYIQNHFTMGPMRAQEIANMSDGNLWTAIQVCREDSRDYSAMLISWFRITYTGNPVTIQEWYSGFDPLSKNEKLAFLEYGLHFLRQFILCLLNAGEHAKATEKEKETIDRMKSVLSVEKATAIIEILERQLLAIPRNANQKIMFLTDSLTIGDIMNGKDNVSLPSYHAGFHI